MLDASEAYQKAIFADIRRIVPKCVINLLDPDVTFGAVTSTGEIAYSKPAQLYDHELKSSGPRYATLEHNRWALDGSVSIFPEDPAETSGEIGFIGAALCGADGSFAVPQVVSLNFTGVSILQACAVYFNDRAYDGIGVDFTVDVLSGADVVYQQQFKLGQGVMTQVPMKLLQSNGYEMYENCVVITESGTWTAPDGVTQIAAVIINGGDGGEFGEDGSYISGYSSIDDPYNEDTVTWDNVPADPKGGAGGQSGKVYAVTLEINPNQSFAVQIGQGGLPGQAGGVTTFGPHSGNLGKHYDGWADVVSGNVYAVDGAQGKPNTDPPTAGADAASGTGNGGQGGYGGTNGAKFYVNGSGLTWRTLREPTSGGSGGNGATGCVIIYYDKEETA